MTAWICNKPITPIYADSDEKRAIGEALLGQPFIRCGETHKLYQVKVWGILGWVSKEDVERVHFDPSIFNRSITSLNAIVYENSDVHSRHVSMLYCGTKVNIIMKGDQWSYIEALGVSGWIFSYHLIVSNVAAQFLGVRQLEGFNSFEGIDSLGLIHLHLSALGYEVPKTLEGISKVGNEVRLQDVKAGDILIYAGGERLGVCQEEEMFIYVNERQVVKAALSTLNSNLIQARRI